MSNSPQLTLHAFDSSSKTKKVDKERRLSTKHSSCSTIDVCLSVCLQRAQIWQRYTLKGKPKQNFVFFLLQRVEAERSGLNYCCQATAENKRASGDISKLNRSLRRKKSFKETGKDNDKTTTAASSGCQRAIVKVVNVNKTTFCSPQKCTFEWKTWKTNELLGKVAVFYLYSVFFFIFCFCWWWNRNLRVLWWVFVWACLRSFNLLG